MEYVDMDSELKTILKMLGKIVDDHEKRIRSIEKAGLICLGAGLVIKFLIK